MCECEEKLFNSRVIDSRKLSPNRQYCTTIYRRRVCNNCGDRFTTAEAIVDYVRHEDKLVKDIMKIIRKEK